ncbi:hypothetical protein SRHO_G00071090 [Serrasalmus rhombeus]
MPCFSGLAELALARKHRSIMVFVISPASGLTEGSESAEECLAESAPEQREGKEEESQHPGQGILLNAFLAAVPLPDPTAQRRHRAKCPDQSPLQHFWIIRRHSREEEGNRT